jgi:hypothetical protein
VEKIKEARKKKTDDEVCFKNESIAMHIQKIKIRKQPDQRWKEKYGRV